MRRLEKKSLSIYRDGRRFCKKPGYKIQLFNGCVDKIKFKTLSAAENHILHFHTEDFEMLPYRCNYCKKWHVGHSVRRIRAVR